MFVAIDTNVFVRESHLLRKKAGPPLIHFLRASGGQLFIPEILASEYNEQTKLAVAAEVAEINAAFSKVKTLVGVRDGYRVPSDEQVASATEARLRDLAPLTHAMSLSDEILLAASRRSMDKRPPTSKSDHGLKDCVIWESILRLPWGSDVRLITRDAKAFLSEKALIPILAKEAEERGIHIVAYESLEQVLSELQTSGVPVIDRDYLFERLHQSLQSTYADALERWSLVSLGGEFENFFDPFCTESVSTLYVTFVQSVRAEGAVVNGTRHAMAKVRISGSFNWNVESGQLDKLQVESEAVLAPDDSVLDDRKTAFMSAHMSIFGRKSVKHTVKKPLLRKDTIE